MRSSAAPGMSCMKFERTINIQNTMHRCRKESEEIFPFPLCFKASKMDSEMVLIWGGGGRKSLCHEKKYIDVSMFTYIGMINLTMVVNSTKSDRDFKIMIL